VTLSIAAAASLKKAINALAAAYTAANPGTTFTVTTDSSAALRTQIEQGAPVDVFLSADTKNPQAIVDGGLASGDPVPFAANTVALIVPADNRAEVAGPADLAKPGLRLVAAGEQVPITAYADQVVANLAKRQPDPDAWSAAVAGNVVSREDNVAAVLARIELGEGDAGLVYATDAAGSSTVVTMDIPADANVRATHAGIVPSTSREPDAAAAFLAWVAGPEGQAVLAPLGFLTP
jgi:molybdate transport system substrate-binding protein